MATKAKTKTNETKQLHEDAVSADARAALLAVEADLNTVLLEREEEVRAIILALVARQHLFMLGVPGTAKSLLATETCDRIEGAKRFDYLFGKFTEPGEVFGPLNLQALSKGDYKRVSRGMLQEADVAFLDEIWKSNSALLNVLLPTLNERLYRENGHEQKIPLESMVCASNEMPQGDDLGAIYDRILFRFVVQPLSDGGVRRMLLHPPRVGQPHAKVTREQLRAAQKGAAAVTITEQTIDTFLAIRQQVQKVKGVEISDRRIRACFTVVQASAWLAGRTETTDEDCLPLQHVLWANPEHRSTVEIGVISVAAPALRELRDLKDVAIELSTTFANTTDENVRVESLMKLAGIAKRANAKAKDTGDEGRKIARRIAAMHSDAVEANTRRMASAYGADDLFEEDD